MSSVKKAPAASASDEAPRRATMRVKRPAWKLGRPVYRGKITPAAATPVAPGEDAVGGDEEARPRRRLTAPLRRRAMPGNPMASAVARARARRYTTRSEAPPQMLRNGKKIRFREPPGGLHRPRRSGDWTPATPGPPDWENTSGASVKMEETSPPDSPTPNGEVVSGAVAGPAKTLTTRRSELELLLNSDPVPPPLVLPTVAPVAIDEELPDAASPRTDSNCNLFAIKGKRGKARAEEDVEADWEAGSTVSTPSSRNADDLDDGLSTDCEGRDVRRSRRSTIRKSRAALLRLAPGKRANEEEEPVPLPPKVETVVPPPPPEEVIKAPLEPNDPRAEAKRLSDDAKRRRIKSLSTQDIVSLVDKGLFPSKARRASDFGALKLSVGAGFTLPASSKGKLKLVAASIRKNAPLKLENGAHGPSVASESSKIPSELSVDAGHEDIGEASEPPPPPPAAPVPAIPFADMPMPLLEPCVEPMEADVSDGLTQVGELDNGDVAEKLREISMRFEADVDILPSLNIKGGDSILEEIEFKPLVSAVGDVEKMPEKKLAEKPLEKSAENRIVEKTVERILDKVVEKSMAKKTAEQPVVVASETCVDKKVLEKTAAKVAEKPVEKIVGDKVVDKPVEKLAANADEKLDMTAVIVDVPMLLSESTEAKPETTETEIEATKVAGKPDKTADQDKPQDVSEMKPEGCEKTEATTDSKVTPPIREVDLLTAEQRAAKESVLGALGLQSLEAAARAKRVTPALPRPVVPGYTGTLKAVIKLQRSPEKRTRTSKMKLNVSGDKKAKRDKETHLNGYQYSICKEAMPADENVPGGGGAAGLPAGNGNRKCLKPPISFRSYFDITSNPTLFAERPPSTEDIDPETESTEAGGPTEEKAKQSLVIPEKASSFSIHPGRLCSDVCSYCFGKFGSLDTPCHIAQLRGSDKQVNILQAELHLTAESCLCDACYRHVDRKANCPAYREKAAGKESLNLARNRPTTACCVQGCQQPAEHHVRRKWLNKLKRSIAKKVPVSSNKLSQHTALPLCAQHFAWVDLYMACGICRRRLTCNQMYPLGPEVGQVNKQLEADRIPVHLTEKVFLCKLCRYYSQLIVKHPDRSRLSGSNKMFYESYRKKIFHGLDMEVPADPAPSEPPAKRRKKLPPPALLPLVDDELRLDSPPPLDLGDMLETQLTEDSPAEEAPAAATANSKPRAVPKAVPIPPAPLAEIGVTAHADFSTARTVRSDSEGAWERCNFTLQYDVDSRAAFERLRRPYGSQSAFFKHLLTLEQYWRAGELVPAGQAHSRTRSYLKSVSARVHSFQATVVPTPVAEQPAKRRVSEAGLTPVAAAALLSPGSSSNPLFVSQGGATKFSVNPATGELLAPKRKPNIVQVTKGGQPLFRLVDPTKSQIRALQGYKRKAPSAAPTAPATPSNQGPMICDVRSLPAEAWPSKVAITTVKPVKRSKEVTILPKGKGTVGGLPLALSNSLEVSVSPIYPKDSANR